MDPLLSNSIDTLMTQLEWLQRHSGVVGKETRMKECVQDNYTFFDLKRELGLLRGIFCCTEKFLLQNLVSQSEENMLDDQTLESFYNQLGDTINRKIRQGLELDHTRCDALFFSFVNAVETLKPLVRKVVDKYLHSSQFKQCTKEELVDIIQLVIDVGNIIHRESCLDSLLLHKLYFLKCLIRFVASGACIGRDKLQDLLARTQVLVFTASFYSYMLLRPQDEYEETFLLIESQSSEMLQDVLGIILKDCTTEELLDFIQLVSEEGKEIHGVKIVQSLQLNKLKFLKDIISFAASQHVGEDKLQDLLAHAKVVVTTAACCSYMHPRSEVTHGKSMSTVRFQYSEMLNVKLNVRESYMKVLKALGSSRSPDRTKLDDNIVRAFIDSLLVNHWELLLGSKFSFTVSSMKILIEELRFLKYFLIYKRQEGGDLDEEMTNLIFDVVNEAGLVSYSISWDDWYKVPTKDTKLGLSNWMEKVQLLRENVAKKYPETSRYKFSRINELGFLDGLLENLNELMRCSPESIAFARGELDVVPEDLVFLRDFFRDIVNQRNEHEELKSLWIRVVDIAGKYEFVINSLVVGDSSPDFNPTSFNVIREEIKKFRVEVKEISEENRSQIGASSTPKNSNHLLSRITNPTMDDVVVGFEDAAEDIINRLGANSATLKLDIVSIVGMPGQGKTTLAKKVYNDINIRSKFHICAWCCVSQGYQKRKLLLDILSDISHGINYSEKTDQDLENDLRRLLLRRRYLIILDDIWDIESWRGLKLSFPDDSNGSRILITSRIHFEEFREKTHFLRLLNYDESRKLLQTRLPHNKGCPEKIQNLVADVCKGLPLAVVTVAGILKNLEQDSWEEFAESLSTALVCDTEGCTELLQLSYIHLPEYLKPCFLYFGSFLQDKEILVARLIWLWIAEGFVKKTTDEKSLEDVAQDYLKDLIDRSLVMVAKETSRGGIKACSVHDLVHQFCVTKAKEENFLDIIKVEGKTRPLSDPQLLCVSSWGGVQRFRRLSSVKSTDLGYEINVSSILCNFKVLKVLDLRGSTFFWLPAELKVLVHLRFLALVGDFDSVPSTIVKLVNLETFILKGSAIAKEISLPYTLLNMTKLRHVYVRLRNVYNVVRLRLPEDEPEKCCESSNLETLAVLCIHDQEEVKIIRKMPYLRKLKCILFEHNQFPVFDIPSQLESLQVHSDRMRLDQEFGFSVNLKKLTLTNFGFPWASISKFATQLPNLEVLRLLDKAFSGETWDVEAEVVFRKLQYLKIDFLNIRHWINAWSDNFPCLRQIVLHSCWNLQEIASGVGELDTLEIVDVKFCHRSVATWARNLREEREGLKVFILEKASK